MTEPVSAGAPGGRWIIRAAWATNALFALAIVGPVLGLDALDGLASGVSLALFLVSLPVWGYALVLAAARTAQGDDIAISSLFFLTGSAPPAVRRQLLGACAVSIVIAAIGATSNPAAVLVPMLCLGLVGLWGARHGTFPARRDPPTRRRL